MHWTDDGVWRFLDGELSVDSQLCIHPLEGVLSISWMMYLSLILQER